jgi:hypothetical protein
MCFGAASNIYGILNPIVITSAAELTSIEKLSYYTDFILILALIPYSIALIAFKFFESTEKNVRYKK